jgi:hypothetical protein
VSFRRAGLALAATSIAAACLTACGKARAGGDAGAAAIETGVPGDASPLAALREDLEQCRRAAEAEKTRAAERIAALETELQAASADRIRREREWLAYTQTISKLGEIAGAPPPFPTGDPAIARAAESSAATESSLAGAGGDPASGAGAGLAAAAALPPSAGSASVAAPAHSSPPAAERESAAVSSAEKRDREIFLTLRSLMMIEQVRGFDLLESGTLQRGATGPIVLRVLDDRGRPLGTLCADRLRLEASRAARSLTLVLEDGYERIGAVKTPFADVPHGSLPAPPGTGAAGAAEPADSAAPVARSARRILLPDVDPRAWIEALPELFKAEEKAPPPDDGRWDLGALRAALNDLLRLDAAGGFYRVQGITGVQGDTLRDVVIDGLDRDGRLERKLFADRVRIAPVDQGLMILLEGGAQMRGDEKTAFLDGRYRIFLPRADLEEWRKAGVPGLSPAPGKKP